MQIPNDLLLTTNSTLESRRSREGRLTYARGVRFREPERPGTGYERWRQRLWRPTGRPARVQGPTAHARELHLFALGGGRIPPSFRRRRMGRALLSPAPGSGAARGPCPLPQEAGLLPLCGRTEQGPDNWHPRASDPTLIPHPGEEGAGPPSAVPRRTPGSAFSCRHGGVRPRQPVSRCCR